MITVVSAAFGAFAPPPPPPDKLRRDHRFLLFTDGKGGPGWERISVLDDKPRRIARHCKTHAWAQVKRGERFAWIDSRYAIRGSFAPLFKHLSSDDIGFFRHPKRRCPYAEGRACLALKRGGSHGIQEQLAFYRKEGLPANFGLWASGVIVGRRTETVEELMKAWWGQIERYSLRDQVSLPYVFWKTGMRCATLPGNLYRPGVAVWRGEAVEASDTELLEADLSRADVAALRKLCEGKSVVEVGAGGSTPLLHGWAKTLVSYETDPEWLDAVKHRLPEATVRLAEDPERADPPQSDCYFIDCNNADRRRNAWLRYVVRHRLASQIAVHDCRRQRILGTLTCLLEEETARHISRVHYSWKNSHLLLVEVAPTPRVYANWHRTEPAGRTASNLLEQYREEKAAESPPTLGFVHDLGDEEDSLSYDDVIRALRYSRPFAYARYGNGEFRCILGGKGKNRDGHEYTPDLGRALAESLRKPQRYHLGKRDVGGKLQKRIDEYLKGLGHVWASTEILSKASMRGRLGELFDCLKQRTVALVGPPHLERLVHGATDEHEHAFADKFIEIPSQNCWRATKRVMMRLNRFVQDHTEVVVVFCANMPSCVWIDRVFDAFPGATYIDAGSVFEPYVGHNTRSYHHTLRPFVDGEGRRVLKRMAT